MIVIHHNPDCGTSRNVLRVIEAAGYKPIVIEYLKEGWTKPQLLGLFAAANLIKDIITLLHDLYRYSFTILIYMIFFLHTIFFNNIHVDRCLIVLG